MIFKGKRYTKTVFLSIIRQYFKNNNKFTLDSKNTATKIFIDEMSLEVPEKYPCIIISDISPSIVFDKGLDRNFAYAEYNDKTLSKDIHLGRIVSSLRIDIMSLNLFESEMIADELLSLFLFLLREDVKKSGFEIINVKASNMSVEPYGKQNIYKFNIDVETFKDWEYQYTYNEIDTINKITIPDYEGLMNVGFDGSTNAYF